jgi:hypothetical protein
MAGFVPRDDRRLFNGMARMRRSQLNSRLQPTGTECAQCPLDASGL